MFSPSLVVLGLLAPPPLSLPLVAHIARRNPRPLAIRLSLVARASGVADWGGTQSPLPPPPRRPAPERAPRPGRRDGGPGRAAEGETAERPLLGPRPPGVLEEREPLGPAPHPHPPEGRPGVRTSRVDHAPTQVVFKSSTPRPKSTPDRPRIDHTRPQFSTKSTPHLPRIGHTSTPHRVVCNGRGRPPHFMQYEVESVRSLVHV